MRRAGRAAAPPGATAASCGGGTGPAPAEDNVAFFWGVNVLDVETEGGEDEPEGYRARSAQLGPRMRAEKLGATVYDLEPGESGCPYHYEVGAEEWLIVLAGKPTVRDEDGDEYELKPWDVVSFIEGPDGAHKVTNNSAEPARVMIVSTKDKPVYAVYPDSNKIGIWPEGKIFKLDSAVDYYDGEL